jgi:hypothetical protein
MLQCHAKQDGTGVYTGTESQKDYLSNCTCTTGKKVYVDVAIFEITNCAEKTIVFDGKGLSCRLKS